jgi:DNA modification methylase
MYEVIAGNSRQVLEGMIQRVKPSFDMIFLDPPYYDWGDNAEANKPDPNWLSWITTRLLKNNGVIFLCGMQPQLAEDYKYWSRFYKLAFEFIQYKHSGTPALNKFNPIRVHENIWCLIRKDDKISDTKIDVRRSTESFQRPKIKHAKITRDDRRLTPMKIRYGSTLVEWRTDVGYPKSVVECMQIGINSKEYLGHPTQKPINLMKLLVKISTEEGDCVLDPFAGSGTTLQACEELGRNSIGIEINPEYIGIIRRRLERARQLAKISQWM